jgi:C1A family cysteine protease
MKTKPKMGWIPDLPDIRDFTHTHKDVQRVMLSGAGIKGPPAPPATVDLEQWCSPIEDQSTIGSCGGNAGAGLIEYYERRAFNAYIDVSRLFLYKVARNLDGDVGDTGTQLRTIMKVIAMFGAPPEENWPYNVSKYDEEPSAMLYAMASNYKASTYFRLDPHGSSPQIALQNVKSHLAQALPCIFGFTVYSSMPGCGAADDGTGNIPMPKQGDSVQGGHAVMAVGYDDNRKIGSSVGALKIRNSWGADIGDHGYFYMPYDYVLRGIADDFWTLVKADFIDTRLFA